MENLLTLANVNGLQTVGVPVVVEKAPDETYRLVVDGAQRMTHIQAVAQGPDSVFELPHPTRGAVLFTLNGLVCPPESVTVANGLYVTYNPNYNNGVQLTSGSIVTMFF